MTNAMKRLLYALRTFDRRPTESIRLFFNKGKCVYWVYEMTLGNGTTGMAVNLPAGGSQNNVLHE